MSLRTVILALALRSATPFGAGSSASITQAEVDEAQAAWGAGIVAIGAAYTAAGDYTAVAQNHLDTLYGYKDGFGVLFKPTKAKEVPFRPTEEEALSYFVTGIVVEDTGFAIAPYTAVAFDNHGCIFDSDSATCMGEYYFTGTDSSVTKVEYTFGYKKDAEGNLKIVVHHSSLPYGS